MSKRVVVLMGGWSSEREVSLVSGAAVSKALAEGGYAVRAIDVVRDPADLMARLTPRPDVIFNALHGRWGEDGTIQGLLDILAIPYTHSGLLASALAMHKPSAKVIFEHAGIPVAEHVVVGREAFADGDPLPRPYVIKPLNEGSSVGVRIVRNGDNLAPLSTEWSFGDYRNGRTLHPRSRIYRRRHGRPAARGHRDHHRTRLLRLRRQVCARRLAACHPGAGRSRRIRGGDGAGPARSPGARCRGVSRADLRYDGERLYMLEVNTQPGMTPTSLVPEQAAYVGISFTELVAWMVEHAEFDA